MSAGASRKAELLAKKCSKNASGQPPDARSGFQKTTTTSIGVAKQFLCYMKTKKRFHLLTQDDQFVERMVLYATQHSQLHELLSNDYQNEIIPVLKDEISLNRKWIYEKIRVALNQYQERYAYRISKQIEIPTDFSELMAPIFEVRKQKALYVASQSFEGAARLREKELKMMAEPNITLLIQEFNNSILKVLKSCETPQDYFVSGNIILIILEPHFGSTLPTHQKELERICIKWLLNQEAAILELSNQSEQKLALALIGIKKSKWEAEVMMK